MQYFLSVGFFVFFFGLLDALASSFLFRYSLPLFCLGAATLTLILTRVSVASDLGGAKKILVPALGFFLLVNGLALFYFYTFHPLQFTAKRSEISLPNTPLTGSFMSQYVFNETIHFWKLPYIKSVPERALPEIEGILNNGSRFKILGQKSSGTPLNGEAFKSCFIQPGDCAALRRDWFTHSWRAILNRFPEKFLMHVYQTPTEKYVGFQEVGSTPWPYFTYWIKSERSVTGIASQAAPFSQLIFQTVRDPRHFQSAIAESLAKVQLRPTMPTNSLRAILEKTLALSVLEPTVPEHMFHFGGVSYLLFQAYKTEGNAEGTGIMRNNVLSAAQYFKDLTKSRTEKYRDQVLELDKMKSSVL